MKYFKFIPALIVSLGFLLTTHTTYALTVPGLNFSPDTDATMIFKKVNFSYEDGTVTINKDAKSDKVEKMVLDNKPKDEASVLASVVEASKVTPEILASEKKEEESKKEKESNKSNAATEQVASTNIAMSNSSGGLNPEVLFQMANAHRASIGKPPFVKDERSCALAASRAPEVNAEVYGGYMHAGLKARNLDYWNTENIIAMRTEAEAFNWWINDYIHRIAIEGDYIYSCVACSGNACAQEFTNFQPK